MTKTDLSDIIQLLQFTGHYFTFEGRRRTSFETLQKLRVIFMVACNPFTLSSLFIGGLKKSMGVELFFGLMGFLTAMQHVYAFNHRKDTEDIIQAILRVRRKYQKGSDAEFKQDTRMIWKVVYIYFSAMTALMVFYITLPKILDVIYGIIWDDPIALRLPQSMDAFLEEHQHRNLKYVIVSLISSVWSIVSTYSHFGLDTFLCLIGFYYSSLVKTFCNSLKLDTSLSSEQLTIQIKTFAAHHHELYKLSLRMRSIFGCPYAMQNTFGAFCIVSLVYAILSDDSGGPLILLANIFNLMILAGMLTSTAYVGQHVTNESSAVFDALYGLPWDELSPTNRKYFVTMICAAREPFTIHFHGRAPLNLTNFMAILNTSYSYFMFMRSTL
uniref:Odorant receptor n=1 Tax=Adelphocoris lineolatus TaxID=236346 RepID=A0A2I4PH35_ADELI|nr:olfactory receptor 30 [Adelphocoris lineolatus]